MADPAHPPAIYVLAGTNGAGKSSVAGTTFRQLGADFFNPDEAARAILERHPGISQEDANGRAWLIGRRLLERSIAERLTFAFETTLGGATMTRLLQSALAAGLEVRIWYVGLTSPELHLARVRARVARGGHDIPEGRIRERYDRSRINLIRLLPALTELMLFDNSAEADPALGVAPKPRLILHVRRGTIRGGCDLEDVPHWAKPIVLAAMRK